MSVKSIIDVEIDDTAFKEFGKLFSAYKKKLEESKSNWKDVNNEVNKSSSAFEDIAASLLAISVLQKKISTEEEHQEEHTRKTSSYWQSMVRGSRELAANVASTTKNLLTWGAIGTAFSGLLGAGSLFGLDRLAQGVGSGRRSSLGLGIGYGEQQAFSLNYSRVVDPNQFLASVQESLQDVTKRSALYGAGLSESDLRGKNAAQVGSALLPHLKSLADRTPPELLAQVLQSRGLDHFISLQDAQRLRGTSSAELAGYGASYKNDVKSLGLSGSQQSTWQNFAVQLSRAGRTIETVFVRGLTPLIPGLTRLSDVIGRTLANTLQRLAQSGAIDKFGEGIEHLAGWIGSDDFQTKIKTFAEDVVALGGAIHDALGLLGIRKGGDGKSLSVTDFGGRTAQMKKELAASSGGKFNTAVGNFFSNLDGAHIPGGRPWNNPGNLRPVGKASGFQQFNTIDDGVRALAHQIQLYASGKSRAAGGRKLETISDIVKVYAPKSENDTAAYIRNVSKRTGYAADAKINVNDLTQLARLLAAIVKQENSKTTLNEGIILKILQAPGANVVASSNQLSGQR